MNSKNILINKKVLQTPEFIPSITSVKNYWNYNLLLEFLSSQQISNFMISAYDIFYLDKKTIQKLIYNLRNQIQLVFFDSGAFEYYNLVYPRKWNCAMQLDLIKRINTDVVVSLDSISNNELDPEIFENDNENYNFIRNSLQDSSVFYEFVLQGKKIEIIKKQLNKLVIDKKLLAFCIPEKNLGLSFQSRKEKLTKILDLIKKNYGYDEILFHLMGCSYPKFLFEYAKMGVDLFDGLHWHDSIYNPENNSLLDFSELLNINCNCEFCEAYRKVINETNNNSEDSYFHYALSHNLMQYKTKMNKIREGVF